MPFQARRQATCSRCQKAIEPGMLVKWARRGLTGMVHANCQSTTPPALTTPAPKVEVMPEGKTKITHPDGTVTYLDIETTPTPLPERKVMPPFTQTGLADKVKELCLEGRLIQAIKEMREQTGLGLKEAKDLVEQIRDGKPYTMPQITKTTPTPGAGEDNKGEGEGEGESKESDKPESELAKALKTLGKHIPTQLSEEQIRNIVQDAFDKIPKSDPIKIDVVQANGEIKRIEGAHIEMARLMYLIAKRKHAYLYGGPGSGKSTAAKMAADALNIPFGYISLNPQTPDSRLMGYMDANGNYRETLFYKLYKHGGVFCIDEMDNASASLLTTLNSCLENGHGAFPDGMIQRHPDFVVVATGNTAGKGANPQFPDRRPFDSAFSERFTFINWEYDLQLEERITMAINPNGKGWLNWVRRVRDFAKKNHPKVIVSPRASFLGAEYLIDSGWTVEQIAESVLFKGIDKDTKAAIINACPYPVTEKKVPSFVVTEKKENVVRTMPLVMEKK